MKRIAKIACGLVFVLFAGGVSPACGEGSVGLRRIVFDDWFQRERDPGVFSQGVATEPGAGGLANFYAIDSSATANGFFALTRELAPWFEASSSSGAPGEDLLAETDVYVLCCPIRKASGGRADLGESEARLLERWVEGGGGLVLILNSFVDPASSAFDIDGMNRVAGAFGLAFEAAETGTQLLPIEAGHPRFPEARNMIYGNGCTIGIDAAALPETEVMLRDHDGRPVAVRKRHGRGSVLLFGDAGTFGNAHLARTDIDQATATREFFLAALPDGPLAHPLWQPGDRFTLTLHDEQAVTGAVHENRLRALPLPPETRIAFSEPRPLDILLGPDGTRPEPEMLRTSTAVRERSVKFAARVEKADDGLVVTFREGETPAATASLGPHGALTGLAAEQDFADWSWLLAAALPATQPPPHARPGDHWHAPLDVPLPCAGFTDHPATLRVSADCRLEAGDGRHHLVFTAHSPLTAAEFARILPPGHRHLAKELAFQSGAIDLAGRLTIDSATGHPVETSMTLTTTVWFTDAAQPPSYTGTHDWRTFETWEKILFTTTYGRRFTARFDANNHPK
jgi:hypothetical protein